MGKIFTFNQLTIVDKHKKFDRRSVHLNLIDLDYLDKLKVILIKVDIEMPPKRNVAFIKPEEPAFLKRMKAQIGFTEPDTTIDTKVRSLRFDKIIYINVMFCHQREAIDNFSDDDDDGVEKDDERPQVVQLKEGDLTAEEAFVMEKGEIITIIKRDKDP